MEASEDIIHEKIKAAHEHLAVALGYGFAIWGHLKEIQKTPSDDWIYIKMEEGPNCLITSTLYDKLESLIGKRIFISRFKSWKVIELSEDD